MEDKKIKELKIAALAYEIANNYDYCQESDMVDDILENFNFNKEDVILACNEYSGSRPDEIADNIIRLINSL